MSREQPGGKEDNVLRVPPPTQDSRPVTPAARGVFCVWRRALLDRRDGSGFVRAPRVMRLFG